MYEFLRYVPPLSQLWAIHKREVLMLDLVINSWYKREFNSHVIDVVLIGNEVLTIKPDRNLKIYQNRSRIYKNHTKICLEGQRRFV